MRILNHLLTLSLLALLSPAFAQVGVGTTNPQAGLDITSTSSGVLIPRVVLTSTATNVPVYNPAPPGTAVPATGTLVYNTNTAGVSPNNVVPGFYYWDSAKWVALAGSAAPSTTAWNITGNAGTTTSHFLGTTDTNPLVFKVNDQAKFTIPLLANQLQGYGGTAASPTYSWTGASTSGMWQSGGNVRFNTNSTSRFQVAAGAFQVHSMETGVGTAATPFYSWSTDTDTGMFRAAADQLGFATAGVDRLSILANGNTGVGNTAPNTKLEVAGALSLNEGSALTFANGNNNNIALGGPFSMYRITGPTAVFSLTGVVPVTGANGQIVTIENTTTFPMTLVHDAAASTAGNRIFCPGAKNLVLTGQYATVTLQYNATQTRWVVTGYVGEATSVNSRDIYAVKGTTDLNLTPATYPATGSFSDMAEMTLTVTPKNSIIYVNFGASGDLAVSPLPGANNIGFRLMNGTTVLGGTASVSTDYDSDDLYGELVATGWNAHFTMFPVAVTPGVPITLKIQWSAAAIYGAPAHNYVSSQPSYAHRNLTIID